VCIDLVWSLQYLSICRSQHVDIAHRLVECQFELTDTLAYYLCSRKPDHRSGQHFIIPEMADSVDVTELAKAARQKLQAVCIYFAISNKLVLFI